MISKIINWVGGGLFRTIGRFIAFVIIGFIIATIINKSDFNIDLSKYLGFEKVNASSITDFRILGSNSIFNTSYQEYKFSSVNGDSVIYQDYNFNYNFTITSTSQTHAVFTYTSYMYHWDEGQLSNGSGSIYDNEMGQFQPRVSLYSTSGSETICEMANGFIVCPVGYNQTYNKIRVQLMLHESQSFPASYTNIYISIFNLEYNVITSLDWLDTGIIYYMQQLRDAINNNFNNAINNQTQVIEQQHNETMNFFADTNVTETNETATSFFSNFTDTDHGGLSSIITAPLTTINAMLSNQCVSPSATWKGATISLPCGDMFWSRQGASDLKNLLNVFYGGFICYYAIRRLFLLIEQLKDPTNDKIEVIDL